MMIGIADWCVRMLGVGGGFDGTRGLGGIYKGGGHFRRVGFGVAVGMA